MSTMRSPSGRAAQGTAATQRIETEQRHAQIGSTREADNARDDRRGLHATVMCHEVHEQPLVEAVAERQDPVSNRATHVSGGDIERAGCAVVREAHAYIDAHAETDAGDREPELPRMAQLET